MPPIVNNPQAPQSTRRGSGFTNLGRILGANQNNRLASTVSAGLSGGASGVRQNLAQTREGFENQSGAQNLASAQNVAARQQALQNIGSGQTNVNPDLQKQFETFRAGQYAGPTQLDQSQVAQIGAKAREVQGYGKQLRGAGDKSQVLQAYVGQGPNYTQGQRNLDTLLLGQGPGVKQMQQAARGTTGLTREIGQQEDTARQIGQLRQGQAQEFGKQTREQLGIDQSGNILQEGTGAFQNLLNPLTGRAKDYNTVQEEALSRFSNRQLTPEDRQRILGTQNPYETWGAVPENYMTPSIAATAQTSASAEERAKLGALGKLSGVSSPIDQEVGFYDPNNPYSFDKAAFQQSVEQGQQRYTAALNAPSNVPEAPTTGLIMTDMGTSLPVPSPTASLQQIIDYNRANPSGNQELQDSRERAIQKILGELKTQYGGDKVL